MWHLIGHQVDFIMAGRGSTWDEGWPVLVTRFRRLDEICWTYSYSRIDDRAPSGISGVLVVCTETTQAVLAERRQAPHRWLSWRIRARRAPHGLSTHGAPSTGLLRNTTVRL